MLKTSSKRRYVVPSASPPTTSDSSADSEGEGEGELIKKKRKCTRNKPNYNENNKPHYRESYVFSTVLANLAASAVKHRMCDTIIIYHQGIPREPNKLTIKPPKVTSKLLATSSVKNRKRERQNSEVEETREKPRSVERKPESRPKPKLNRSRENAEETKPASLKSPLTPPRSPSTLPLYAGDFSLSVSERIKCRARSCAPKFYGELKDDGGDEVAQEPASVRTPSARTPPAPATRDSRRRSNEKSRNQSNERLQRRLRRNSIESDGEKIRNILENSEKAASQAKSAEEESEHGLSDEDTKPMESPRVLPKPIKSPKVSRPEQTNKNLSPSSDPLPVEFTKPSPKRSPKSMRSPKDLTKEPPKSMPTLTAKPEPPKLTPKSVLKPSPAKAEKSKPRLSDFGLFEAALTPKIKSPVRLKKQMSAENKPEKTIEKINDKNPPKLFEKPPDKPPIERMLFEKPPVEPLPIEKPILEKAVDRPVEKIMAEKPSEVPTLSMDQSVSKFKPVKQTSPVTETPAPPPTETPDPNLPKFKPLPISGNNKKSRSFKFRTTHGGKADMNLVDSIFSNDSNSNNGSELSPLTTKPQVTSPPNAKIPVNKLTDKPPRPELVMGIPNLQGPSKPPMLTPAHSAIFQHGSLQHIIRSGPPPLSAPKIAVTAPHQPPIIHPAHNNNVAGKRPSSENTGGGEQRKKKRFAFPTEDTTPPVKVVSPTSPISPITLKGPGSSRVSPISPQTNVDNVVNTPLMRNGLPIHKPSPKNSPHDRRLELLADYSGRRSPLVKVQHNHASPITPRASPSTVGQFYQPNVSVSLTSCSKNDVNMSDSVLEHSKLAGQQHLATRTPVVTINHQTVSIDQDQRGKEAPKPRVTVDSDTFSKKQQQQEIFARQRFSRAFSPFSAVPNTGVPTTMAGKLNKQIEQQLKQQELGSLVDLYGRGESDSHSHSQPAFPTAAQLRPPPVAIPNRQASRQQSPRQRPLPTELLVHQERERLLSQQQERLLAQQRQQSATGGVRDHQGHLLAQRQESLLHRPPGATPNHQHLQHLNYSGAGMLNHIGYPIGLNPQLYKQLAADPNLTQVTSASILQSLAGYQRHLQLAAAAAGKFGSLAHLYQTNAKQSEETKAPNQFGVIRP